MEPPPARSPARRLAALWLVFLAVGLLLRATFFAISVTHLQPSSDESIVMLQAQDIRSGRTPLLFMAQPYLFPLESYLYAPFAAHLPATALGARLPPVLLQLAALALALLLVRRIAQGLPALLGAVLLLVPSTYVLMVQSAYPPPGYASLMALYPLTLLLADQARTRAKPGPWLAATAFVAGLAFSAHMLALPFSAAAVLYAGWADRPRDLARRAAWWLPAALVGLLPHLLARVLLPGAHQAVAVPITAGETLRRLWQPTMDYTLAVAAGLRSTRFPDARPEPAAWPGLDSAFALLTLLLLLVVFFQRARAWLHSWRAEQRLPLHLVDALLAVVLLNLALFAINQRADSSSFRYLLPTAITLPGLVAWLAGRHRAARVVLVLVTFALAVFHIRSAQALMALWRTPSFGATVGIADLDPALRALRELGITRAVASYGTAYRVTFQSGRDIVCAQPYNERFPHWPLPFKAEVDEAPRIAYVLTDTVRFLKPSIFARHLATMGVASRVTTAGAFRIFHDFPHRADRHPLLPRNLQHADAAPSPQLAPRLIDGRDETCWTTDRLQRGGERVDVTWADARPLQEIVLLHGRYHNDYAAGMRVALRRDGAWDEPGTPVAGEPDKFELRDGQPRYGRAARTLPLEGARADGVRVIVESPRTNRSWTLAEIEIRMSETAGGAARPSVSSDPNDEPAP